MPTKKPTWSVYGVENEVRDIVRIYSVLNRCTVGDALNAIVKEWKLMKDKENNTDKSQ